MVYTHVKSFTVTLMRVCKNVDMLMLLILQVFLVQLYFYL